MSKSLYAPLDELADFVRGGWPPEEWTRAWVDWKADCGQRLADISWVAQPNASEPSSVRGSLGSAGEDHG